VHWLSQWELWRFCLVLEEFLPAEGESLGDRSLKTGYLLVIIRLRPFVAKGRKEKQQRVAEVAIACHGSGEIG
jgi:hypothetical protein